MQTFLRGLAAVLVVGASALTAMAMFATAVGFLAGMVGLAAWPFAIGVGCTSGVAIGGILWCLAGMTRPQPGLLTGRGPMWRWLRLVAILQVGFGLMIAVAATTYVVIQLQLRGWWPTGDAIIPLLILFAAFGLAGQGGLLWCAVRVAYPDKPAAAK